MTDFARQSALSGEHAATAIAATGRNALDFIVGAQRALVEEIMVATTEMIDRARTEMHLFSELASKMAEAHSVNNIQTMGEECSRHHIDFLRRDCERFFRHGERMIEATTQLTSKWRKN